MIYSEFIDAQYDKLNNRLVPEIEEGNIEYKLRLDKKGEKELNRMISQLLWRMNEGRNKYGIYEAHYILGIMDDGEFSDISTDDLVIQRNVFESILKKANAFVVDEKMYTFPQNKNICHLVVRKKNNDRQIRESNWCMFGLSGSCKTSIMGRLIHGQKDDGKGFSRKLVLLHDHEKINGITSSMKYDTIGFTKDMMINYAMGIEFDQDDVFKTSDRLVNLIDIPGDFRYMRTILHGLLSNMIDRLIICIEYKKCMEDLQNNMHFYNIAYHLCKNANIQPIILLTKCDEVIDKQMYIDTSGYIHKLFDFMDMPIIQISNMDDQGFAELIVHMSRTPINPINDDIDIGKLFICNETIDMMDTNKIFHGKLIHGNIKIGDPINIFSHNTLITRKIKTIHRKKMSINSINTGNSASFTISGKINKHFDKTTIIMCDRWLDHIVDHCNFKILNDIDERKMDLHSSRYIMYILNQIVPIIVDANNMSICGDNVKFFLLNKMSQFAILKNDIGGLLFVRLSIESCDDPEYICPTL